MKHEKTAKRLKEALNNAGISQQELSELSGVSKASISQYINGSHKPSNISSGKMGKVLHVNPLWLMGFESVLEDNDSCNNEKIVTDINERIRKLKLRLSTLSEEQIEYLNTTLDIMGVQKIQENEDNNSIVYFYTVEEAKSFIKRRDIAAFNGLNNLTDNEIIELANAIKRTCK